MTDRELREMGLAPADRGWIARGAFWKHYPFVPATKPKARR